jgi:hypothetical protein|tara:strand:- start:44 stop:262 length:219 start_codon:yes stop_codon:yes gene_type:complete
MSVIVLEKKYQDTVIELNKVKEQKNEMAADLVEAQSEIAQLKKWLTYSKMTSAQLRDEFATQEYINQKKKRV